MEDFTLPYWIYLCIITMFVGGVLKKILASHLSAASTLVAWLGATVLVERLWAFCLPALLLLALLGLTCCIYFAVRTATLPAALPAKGKAVLITGKKRFLSGVCLLLKCFVANVSCKPCVFQHALLVKSSLIVK